MMKLTILFFIGLFVPQVTAKVGETTTEKIELEAKKRQLAYSMCNGGTFNCGDVLATTDTVVGATCTAGTPNTCTFDDAIGSGCKFTLQNCGGYHIRFDKTISGNGTAQSTVITANADMDDTSIRLVEGATYGACFVVEGDAKPYATGGSLNSKAIILSGNPL